ncbi:hypothetical protein DMN91_001969 [Ooceraea biroi]|uniref:Cytoplasmic dynein 2 light intermediate chain 1 n=1 Tax=Ooceraea biroi TaxID=2015173 RepID=A0A3L8E0U2_OOCBI|nr:hypothetical protein DMN91_001969 [Ooceraea biroi]
MSAEDRDESMRETALRLAIEEEKKRKTDANDTHERSIIILGSKGVGKTTMVYRFLEKDEKPKPTIAMDYSFGRKTVKSLEFEESKKEFIGKILRAIAHNLDASLYYYSSKDKVLVRRLKDLLSYFGFGSPIIEEKYVDYEKPLMIPAGMDSFGRIDLQFPQMKSSAILDTIKQIYVSRIPQLSKNDEGTLEDPSNDPNFNEPIIDRLRVQREEEISVLLNDMMEGRMPKIPVPDPF